MMIDLVELVALHDRSNGVHRVVALCAQPLDGGAGGPLEQRKRRLQRPVDVIPGRRVRDEQRERGGLVLSRTRLRVSWPTPWHGSSNARRSRSGPARIASGSRSAFRWA